MSVSTTPDAAPSVGAWQQDAGGIAWPTIALMLAVLLSEAAVVVLVSGEQIPLWIGTLIATLNAYLAFTVAHEASHGNIRGSHERLAPLEATLGWIAAAILFVPYSGFRAIHLLHHAHVNDPQRDPDHWVAGSNPCGIVVRCFTVALYYYYALLVGSASGTKIGGKARASSVLFLVALWTVFTSLVLSGYGEAALYLWLLPSLLAVGILGFSFDWLPHHPHAERERFRDTRILLIPMLTLPMMWQNYHLIHHLHPRVPFYRYGRCFRRLRSYLESMGAPIEGFAPDLRRPFELQSETNEDNATVPSSAVSDTEDYVACHQITVRVDGRELSFEATEAESILDAALRQNIDLQWACGEGICGTCMLRKASGDVNHRADTDALLESEQDKGYILVCSSRALSDLALEDA